MVKRGRKIPLVFPAFHLIHYPPSERLALLSERLEQATFVLLVEPGILGFGIRKLAQGIRNPANDWNSESKFYRQGIRNPVPGIRNPQRAIYNSKWIANEAVIFQSKLSDIWK